MGKNAGDKIADSKSKRHAQPARVASPLALSDVPGVSVVHLCKGGGRYFRCPMCGRSHPHPPEDAGHYLIGYGLCDFYGCWMPIEGGDRLGVVRVGDDGKLCTVVYGARSSE